MNRNPMEWVALVALTLLGASATASAVSGSVNYGYDGVGRLSSVLYEDGHGEVYAYDPAGNRKTVSVLSPAVFSIPATATVSEGGTLSITVSKTGNPSGVATVYYTTSNGTAIAGTNYTAASGTLSFAVGQTSQTITVGTVDDHRYDGTLSFNLQLSKPSSNAAISQSSSAVTMTDIDSVPVFSITSPAAVTEGSPAVFTVTRTNATSLTEQISYASANGNAIAGTDYTAGSGTLTFASGVTSQTFSISTIADSLYEGTRSFTASISNPTSPAQIGGGQATATGTINDANGPGAFSINSPAAVNEAQPITFTVTETFPSGTTGSRAGNSVNYATANGTAVAGTNYTSASGTLAFPAGPSGNTSQTFTVATRDDNIVTSTLSFSANLSGATNGATISTGSGTGSILEIDNQPPATPVLSPSDQTDYVPNAQVSVVWTAGSGTPVTSFELYESRNGSANTLVYSGTATSWGAAKGAGNYTYSLRACNAYGCSGYSTATAEVQLNTGNH